jgi:hypothetical protein
MTYDNLSTVYTRPDSMLPELAVLPHRPRFTLLDTAEDHSASLAIRLNEIFYDIVKPTPKFATSIVISEQTVLAPVISNSQLYG